MRPTADSIADNVRWLRATNAASETAPAYAVLARAGGEADGTLTVDQPAADGVPAYLNGEFDLPAGGTGPVTGDWPALALYEAADGTPAAGETWGAGAGSWKLRKDVPGFRVVGDPDAELEVVQVEAAASPAAAVSAQFSDNGSGAPAAISANDTWTDSGLQFTLPSAGTWLIFAALDAVANVSAISSQPVVRGRLYDSTNAADVTGSYFHVVSPQVTGQNVFGSGGVVVVYTTTAAATLKVQGLRGSGGTWTSCNMRGSSYSDSSQCYVKIG